MRTVRYALTTYNDGERPEVVRNDNGTYTLVFYRNIDDHAVESTEESGDYQADMLWEVFDHNFEILDEALERVEFDE